MMFLKVFILLLYRCFKFISFLDFYTSEIRMEKNSKEIFTWLVNIVLNSLYKIMFLEQPELKV